MRIGIDIDDTLTDTTPILRKYIKKYNASEEKNIDKITRGTYNVNDKIDFYKKYGHTIGNKILFKSNAVEVVNKLYDEGNEIIIITARTNDFFDDAYNFTYDYLTRNGLKFDKLLVAQIYKLNACINENIDIMIDDAPDTIDSVVENGIDGILFSTSKNSTVDSKGARMYRWDDIYKYIHSKDKIYVKKNTR